MDLPNKESMSTFPRRHEGCPHVYFSRITGPLFRHKLRVMVDFLPEADGGRALDVGFGSGIALKELSARHAEVRGIDVHGQNRHVERMFDLEDVDNIEIYHHDIFQESFQDGGNFDLVFASSVLEHIPAAQMRTGIRNIHNIMNKDGILLLGFPTRTFMTDCMFFAYEKTYKRIRRMFTEVSGFSHKKDHVSGEHEVRDALSGYFTIEDSRYFNNFFRVYLSLKCRKLG